MKIKNLGLNRSRFNLKTYQLIVNAVYLVLKNKLNPNKDLSLSGIYKIYEKR